MVFLPYLLVYWRTCLTVQTFYQPTSFSVRLSRTLRHLYKVPEGHDASVAQGGALLHSSQGSASPIALIQRLSITTRGIRICLLIKDESAKI